MKKHHERCHEENNRFCHKLLSIAAMTLVGHSAAFSCTRALFVDPNQTVLIGRSMDWVKTAGSNLWIFPRGMERNGAAGFNSIKWKSSPSDKRLLKTQCKIV